MKILLQYSNVGETSLARLLDDITSFLDQLPTSNSDSSEGSSLSITPAGLQSVHHSHHLVSVSDY